LVVFLVVFLDDFLAAFFMAMALVTSFLVREFSNSKNTRQRFFAARGKFSRVAARAARAIAARATTLKPLARKREIVRAVSDFARVRARENFSANFSRQARRARAARARERSRAHFVRGSARHTRTRRRACRAPRAA
jgi:hypothetical protein